MIESALPLSLLILIGAAELKEEVVLVLIMLIFQFCTLITICDQIIFHYVLLTTFLLVLISGLSIAKIHNGEERRGTFLGYALKTNDALAILMPRIA